jgi:hypothetical protein
VSDLFDNDELLKRGEKIKVAADERDEQQPSIPAPRIFKRTPNGEFGKCSF